MISVRSAAVGRLALAPRAPGAPVRALRPARVLAVAIVIAIASPAARAAGGHHAVDDAALLAPGECQAESWVDRFAPHGGTVVHAGSGCRVGRIELGVNVDRVRSSGATSLVAGPQAKWARPLSDGVDVGLVLAASWADGRQGYVGSSIVVPLTWRPGETVAVHLNIGRDLLRGARDTARAGVALEWTPAAAWSFVGERFVEGGSSHWRLGARHALTSAFALDLSHAHGLGQAAASRWSLGIAWTFER